MTQATIKDFGKLIGVHDSEINSTPVSYQDFEKLIGICDNKSLQQTTTVSQKNCNILISI